MMALAGAGLDKVDEEPLKSPTGLFLSFAKRVDCLNLQGILLNFIVVFGKGLAIQGRSQKHENAG